MVAPFPQLPGRPDPLIEQGRPSPRSKGREPRLPASLHGRDRIARDDALPDTINAREFAYRDTYEGPTPLASELDPTELVVAPGNFETGRRTRGLPLVGN